MAPPRIIKKPEGGAGGGTALVGPGCFRICKPDVPCVQGLCCDQPPCLRVTFDFRLYRDGYSIGDDFGCPPGAGEPPNIEHGPGTYYPCYQAYPDMRLCYGVAGYGLSIDTLVPWIGRAGPAPASSFNYFVEWEVNADTIWTQADMDTFGAHPFSRFTACGVGCGSGLTIDYYIMRVSVQVYCAEDPGPTAGSYALHIVYSLRHLNGDPAHPDEAEASIIVRSKYNWGAQPTCPLYWAQEGEGPAYPVEGYDCSDNGAGRYVATASATGNFNPLCTVPLVIGDPYGEQVTRRLELTWPCFMDRPIVVQQWDCDRPLPPIPPNPPDAGGGPSTGVGTPPPFPTPTPPPASVVCCGGAFPFGNDPYLVVVGNMVGVDGGFGRGCGTCANGRINFWYYQTPTERGFIGLVFVCDALLSVKVICPAGSPPGPLSWTATATLGGVSIEADFSVPPCTPGYPATYFELALNMNPGTDCAGGCACYGGVLIVAGG